MLWFHLCGGVHTVRQPSIPTFHYSSTPWHLITTKPVVTDVTPPPEDLYIDDPTKPIGYVEQIDWKAWGAKVNFEYNVERGGKIIYEKTFYSNFHPWQSKFIRGTAPVN